MRELGLFGKRENREKIEKNNKKKVYYVPTLFNLAQPYSALFKPLCFRSDALGHRSLSFQGVLGPSGLGVSFTHTKRKKETKQYYKDTSHLDRLLQPIQSMIKMIVYCYKQKKLTETSRQATQSIVAQSGQLDKTIIIIPQEKGICAHK